MREAQRHAEGEPVGVRAESRRHARVPVDFPGRVLTNGLRLHDQVYDVSEAGLGLATVLPLASATPVVIQLELPRGPAMTLRARVVWSRPGSMGLEVEGAEAAWLDTVELLRRELEAV